jgi:hypothetical protein
MSICLPSLKPLVKIGYTGTVNFFKAKSNVTIQSDKIKSKSERASFRTSTFTHLQSFGNQLFSKTRNVDSTDSSPIQEVSEGSQTNRTGTANSSDDEGGLLPTNTEVVQIGMRTVVWVPAPREPSQDLRRHTMGNSSELGNWNLRSLNDQRLLNPDHQKSLPPLP